MKKLFFIALAIVMSTTAFAQPFQIGTSTVNAGVGIGTSLGGLGKSRPALSISFDHGLWQAGEQGVISLGGYVGNTGYKYTDLGYTAKWNYMVVGARAAYHYQGLTSLPELDAYGGVMLAYNLVKYSSDGTNTGMANNYGSGLGFSFFLGGRWFFSENIGAFAELGYGVSVLNVGASFKF